MPNKTAPTNQERARLFLAQHPYKGGDMPGFDGIANRICAHFRNAFVLASAAEMDLNTSNRDIINGVSEALGEIACSLAKTFAEEDRRAWLFRKLVAHMALFEDDVEDVDTERLYFSASRPKRQL